MDPRKQSFLNAVLGERGTQALLKATERSPFLEHALVPRAILAWVQSASLYEGELPGVDGAIVSFEKSERGFSGEIGIGEGTYKFENASVFHLAASVAVALGVGQDEADFNEARDIDLERLGKSIDILAKARRASRELAKAFCPGCVSDKKEHREDCDKVKGEDLEKAKEGPGQAAAPLAPTAPAAPTPTSPQTPTKLPQNPGSAQAPTAKPAKPVTSPKAPTSVKLTRSEAATECSSCGQAQFGDDPFVFRGCMCFRALAAGVRVTGLNKTEVVLELDPRMWDRQGIVTFLESVGRE